MIASTLTTEIPHGKIYQCRNGHLLCAEVKSLGRLENVSGNSCYERCSRNSLRCPTCCTTLRRDDPIRALVAEQSIALLPSSCSRCGEITTRGEMRTHESTCPLAVVNRNEQEYSKLKRDALLDAATEGKVNVVRKFLDDVNAVDEETGDSPLYRAAMNGHKAVVRVLMDAKADLNMANNRGETALHRAARHGHEAVVKILVEAGANLNMADEDGETPLWNAAHFGHEAVVKILVEAKADLNMAEKDGWTPHGWTPLLVAAENGHEAVVRSLVDAKADLNMANKDGWTPLLVAARYSHETVVKILVEAKADLNMATNKDGWTSLHIAAHGGYEAVVRVLTEAGADVNKKCKSGYTPLDTAVQYGHARIFMEAMKKSRAKRARRIV